ncbi:hypothetical protein [Microbacterium sp. JZ31]|uniref:hypothetical protein n=1 Tax=Microbacterium sp. JZ31 TaxID=1906274 RepID=UPI00193446A7|nr:hypothetical protein [Microbacterium sp. JZ31]
MSAQKPSEWNWPLGIAFGIVFGLALGNPAFGLAFAIIFAIVFAEKPKPGPTSDDRGVTGEDGSGDQPR